MRGLPRFNFDAFDEAAEELRSRGYEVCNPADLDRAIGFDPDSGKSLPLDECMARDLPEVCRSDAVVVLPGWQKSEGTRIEVGLATDLGKPVLEYPSLVEIPNAYAQCEYERAKRYWTDKTVEHTPDPGASAPEPREPETILEEAARLVDGDRQAAYGHPADDFTRTAGMWSAYLGVEVTAADVPMMMVMLKASRQRNRPKRDNLTDLAGYARTAEKVLARQGRKGFVD